MFFNQTFQINFTNNDVVVPVPDTGVSFSAVVDQLGTTGHITIIASILLLAILLVLLCLRRKAKTPRTSFIFNILTIFFFSFFAGASTSAIFQTVHAINVIENSVVLDLELNAADDEVISSKDTTLTLDTDYPDGYIVFAYMNEDNSVCDESREHCFSYTSQATTIDDLSVNSYGIMSEGGDYDIISVDSEHPTKIKDSEAATASGVNIPVTYAVRADKSMPTDFYTTNDSAIHFEITPDIYNLHYIDGTDTPQVIEQRHNPVFSIPAAPVKPGYTFLSWNTKADGTGTSYQPGDTITLDYVDFTIYPIWQTNTFIINYDANTTDTVTNMPTTPVSQTGNPTFALEDITPARVGYNFLGWATDPSATTPEHQPGTTITLDNPTTGTTNNQTFYAVWGDNIYTLIYIDGDGTEHVLTQETNPVFTVPAAVAKTGYTFEEWNTKQDGTGDSYTPGGTITLPEDPTSVATLYPIFTANTYVATFNANGGTFPGSTTTTITETYDSNYILPTTEQPTRTGHNFLGWFTAATGGTEVTTSTTVTTAGNHTLYAHWEAIITTYTVHYDANGGTNSPADTTADIEYGQPTSLTLTTDTPTPPEGKEFLGWATTPTATTAEYESGAEYTFPAGITETILHAVYEDAAPTCPAGMPTMQSINSDYIADMTTDEQVEMCDTRDAKVYTVSKLQDGNLWMTQNLALGDENGITITKEDSDITADTFTISSSDAHDATGTEWSGRHYSYDDPEFAYYTPLTDPGNYGNYYNWPAATAGTGTSAVTSGDAPSSICPKGWKLPKGGDGGQFQSLYTAYGSNYDNFKTAFDVVPFGGYSEGGVFRQDEYSLWWSRTAYEYDSDDAYRLYVDSYAASGDPTSSYGKYTGQSVRCVAEGPQPKDLSSIETMQEMTPEIVANTTENTTKQLKDTRDDKLYWVTKLADGNIWMTQNLDLGGDTDMTLTTETTDLHPEKAGGTSEFVLKASKRDFLRTYAVSEMNDPGDYYIANGTASSHTSVSGLAQDAEEWHWHQGNYYNWYAATAGSNASEMSRDQEAPQSICPKGWRLPYDGSSVSKSFADLINKLSLTASNITASPVYFTLAGSYSSSVMALGTNGRLLSSNAFGKDYATGMYGAYTLVFNSSYVHTHNTVTAYNGQPVRCVADTSTSSSPLGETFRQDGQNGGKVDLWVILALISSSALMCYLISALRRENKRIANE